MERLYRPPAWSVRWFSGKWPWRLSNLSEVTQQGNQLWIFIGRTDAEAETPNTLATWCLNVTHLKKPWCWERLKARREGDDRGYDGWMASLTQWTWVWASSGVGDGQGSLAYCSPWGSKESDTTEQLNWNIPNCRSSNTRATWCEEPTHLKIPWCWERLRAEEGDRGWDGRLASPTRWTWAWVDSRSWCWTGRPDVLQVMGSQGVRHNWATKLNWTEPHEESSVTGPSTFLFQKMCDWKNKKVTTGQKSNQITNLCTFSSRICSAVLGKSPHFLYMSFSYCI